VTLHLFRPIPLVVLIGLRTRSRSGLLLLSYHTLFLFFSTARPPPRSKLFPTRRSSDLKPPVGESNRARHDCHVKKDCGRPVGKRSEEHTSELQSRGQLVCRLLLEKKNYGSMAS